MTPDYDMPDSGNAHLPLKNSGRDSDSNHWINNPVNSVFWAEMLTLSGNRKINSLKELLLVTANVEHILQYEKQHHTRVIR